MAPCILHRGLGSRPQRAQAQAQVRAGKIGPVLLVAVRTAVNGPGSNRSTPDNDDVRIRTLLEEAKLTVSTGAMAASSLRGIGSVWHVDQNYRQSRNGVVVLMDQNYRFDRRASGASVSTGRTTAVCADSAQWLSAFVTPRQRLTACSRHDLGAGWLRAAPGWRAAGLVS